MLSDELTFVVRVVPENTDALHDILCSNRYHTPDTYRIHGRLDKSSLFGDTECFSHLTDGHQQTTIVDMRYHGTSVHRMP